MQEERLGYFTPLDFLVERSYGNEDIPAPVFPRQRLFACWERQRPRCHKIIFFTLSPTVSCIARRSTHGKK
jgi:hypothetical protein